MVSPTQWNGKFIAYSATKSAVLREAKMMGICRPTPANQTRLFGHKLDVVLVTKPARLADGAAIADGIDKSRLAHPAFDELISTMRTASMRGFGGSTPNNCGGSPFSTQRQNFLSAVTIRC